MATTRMTQTQLVKALAAHGQVTNKVAKDILEGLATTAISEVKKNGVFVLPGIGRLVRVDRKARTGPQPGDRRNHQDSGQEGREVPRGQGR